MYVNDRVADFKHATAPVTTTADLAVKAAAGGNLRNYITSFQYQNIGAVATEVVLKDGSTIIWRGYAAASMAAPACVNFGTPLRGSANTAVNFAAITTGANIYINTQGYTAL